jgi:outer membrane biosynthesis protein TonB
MASALEATRRRALLEEVRGRVVSVLDRVAGVRHQDDESFGPLVTAQLKAREAKAAALALGDATAEQAQALVDSVKPYADFLMMLEGTDALDDEKFSSLEDSVSKAFGRQIAVAIARGRLLLPGQAPRPAPEPEPPKAAPAPPPAPEPVVAAPPPPAREPARTVEEKLDRMPAPKYEPPPEPVRVAEPVAAAPVAPAAQSGPPSAPDETAQWWLAAWARWSGWKGTLSFADAVKEELSKYPYLLSVPIQKSPEFEDGLLAYGYSIIMEHVEKQNPGAVGNALSNLKAGQSKPVGEQLFDYLVTEGNLTQTYVDFVKNVLLAAVPEPGPWVQARIIHSKDDTRVFQRPSPRIGETEQTAQRFLADAQRFTEHKFSASLAPMTARFFLIQAELKDAHGVEAKLKVGGAPSDSAIVLTVPAAGKATKIEARRFTEEGVSLPGLGKDHLAIWFAVFNENPARQADFQLGITLRKDVRGMKK